MKVKKKGNKTNQPTKQTKNRAKEINMERK
jgi:hypothetical protein